MSLFPSIFSAFSLYYGEYVVRSFLPDGVFSTLLLLFVVFFTLTDRASTIPSNTRGCQSGTCVIEASLGVNSLAGL